MLKTISAALLAVSVLAAPALAANPSKTTTAPVTKTTTAPVIKSTTAPVIKAEPAKSKVLNANAHMGRHHVKHARHYRHHKQIGMLKTHVSPVKHIAPVKRG